MRNTKLALVAALAVGLISLAGVKTEPTTAANGATQPVRSAT